MRLLSSFYAILLLSISSINALAQTKGRAPYTDENGNRIPWYVPHQDRGQTRSEVDINNNIVENKISFKQNTILGYYSDEKGQNALFKVTSNEEGNRLFKFLADNSIVEFGVVNTSSGSSYLMTNNDRKSVNITNKAIELDHRGETITAIIHSHPNNKIPSGFDQNDTRGDRFAAVGLVSSHGFPVDYYVYSPKYEYLINYNSQAINKRASLSWYQWTL